MFKFMLRLRRMHQPSWIENVAIAVFAIVTLPVVIKCLVSHCSAANRVSNHLV